LQHAGYPDHETRLAGAPSFRFSTDALPEAERIGIFREVFAQKILGMDIEPLPGRRFRTDMSVKQLSGLNIVWARNSAVRAGRTRHLIADGKDGLAFQWASPPGFGEHLGREVELGANDGILISCCDPGSIAIPSVGRLVSLTLPRNALGPLLQDADGCLARPVPSNTPALRLLAQYVEILRDDSVAASAELQSLAVAHIRDLLALALGPTRDALELARRRGVRAARLQAIKKDIFESTEGALSVDLIAARHRISPRHVQRLFEEEGTTFTEFVREQRLLRAHSMLISRRFGGRSVSTIALDAGFGDLSYFNRVFRRRFGLSPSEVREHERRDKQV
jgi:AraC-like DNA-binding protein